MQFALYLARPILFRLDQGLPHDRIAKFYAGHVFDECLHGQHLSNVRHPMYLLIVLHGNEHRMQVDQRNMVLDLSTVTGSLVDPTITKVEWSQVQDGKTIRDGGIISRGASRQQFYDRSALSPYIIAFEAEWLRRNQDQSDHNARAERAVLVATEAEAAAYQA